MSERKLILYTAASLDGFIATDDHDLRWLFQCAGEGDNGYSQFYGTVDTVLMGRTTYEWIIEHETVFPYKGKECYVFTRTRQVDNRHVQFISTGMAAFVKELKRRDGGNIWLVGGGKLNGALLKARLIDELLLTIAPVLLGTGVPLFSDNENQVRLKLKEVTRYNQFMQMQYKLLY